MSLILPTLQGDEQLTYLLAAVINNIQLPETIIEGTEITIDALVTDPGNDLLTYTWNFDDDNVVRTNCRSPQPINHGHSAIALHPKAFPIDLDF